MSWGQRYRVIQIYILIGQVSCWLEEIIGVFNLVEKKKYANFRKVFLDFRVP